jgi:hypothetical protein
MSVSNPNNSTNLRRNVFISYRVKDTAAATGRLVDALKQRLDEDQVFMDIDKLEPGVDFTEVISRSLDTCDVMLAIIGPDWSGYNPDTKKFRIQESNDWVRLELATALKRKIRVVPVLVDEGVLPDEADLPEELHPLLRRQSYELSNKRWKYDTDQLITFLENTCGIYGQRSRSRNQPAPAPVRSSGTGSLILKITGAVVVCMIVLGVIGIFAEQEEKKNAGNLRVNPPQEEPHGAYSNTDPVVNNNNNTGDAPRQVTANISGRWQDPVNSGVFVFEQSGNGLQLITYSGVGDQTGSGTGTINGKKIHLDVNLLNVALVAIEATLSDNEREITGQYKIQQNGAAYTEQMRLVR